MAGRLPLPRAVFDFESASLELPRAVAVDTSFVVGFLNPNEVKHAACVEFVERLTAARTTLVYNRLVEIELAEVAFRGAIKERHGSNRVAALRRDGRVRARASRIMRELTESWSDVVATRPSLLVELHEVQDSVHDAIGSWGLGSYDAVHASTAIIAGAPLVAMDVGFGDVPAEDLTIYTDASRVAACRRRRGGRGD